jgi:hypothetical protein
MMNADGWRDGGADPHHHAVATRRLDGTLYIEKVTTGPGNAFLDPISQDPTLKNHCKFARGVAFRGESRFWGATPITQGGRTMLKTFAVAPLAFAMSAGLAQAKWHMHKHMIPGCPVGQRAAATCVCGIDVNGRPMLCQKGQWCHNPFAQVCFGECCFSATHAALPNMRS